MNSSQICLLLAMCTAAVCGVAYADTFLAEEAISLGASPPAPDGDDWEGAEHYMKVGLTTAMDAESLKAAKGLGT